MGIEWVDGDPKPRLCWDDFSRDRQRGLAVLALVCAVIIAFVLLATIGPSDAEIEGNQRSSSTTVEAE